MIVIHDEPLLAPLHCVVDASVAAKLYVDEPLSDRAYMLFAHLQDTRAKLCVPDILYAEVTSVLLKLVRNKRMSSDDAAAFLAELLSYRLIRYRTTDLVAEAYAIAHSSMIALYDALYVALAVRLSVPFVTDDARLMHALQNSACDVRALSRLSIPPAL